MFLELHRLNRINVWLVKLWKLLGYDSEAIRSTLPNPRYKNRVRKVETFYTKILPSIEVVLPLKGKWSESVEWTGKRIKASDD